MNDELRAPIAFTIMAIFLQLWALLSHGLCLLVLLISVLFLQSWRLGQFAMGIRGLFNAGVMVLLRLEV